MTLCSSLPTEIRLLIAGIVFIISFLELALAIYRYVCEKKIYRSAGPGIVFILLLAFVSAAMQSGEKAPAALSRLPWITFPLLALAVATHSVLSILLQNRKYKEEITPDSVRESVDGLDSGICFADGSGRLILVNRSMNRLISPVLGRYPRTVQEIQNVLTDNKKVKRVGEDSELWEFPDGHIWKISDVSMDDEKLEGFMQITAQDMTKLQKGKEKLEKDNRELQDSITRMKEMIERMADLAREQETLALKMQVHNDIGASLISLSELASGDNEEDTGKQIETLTRALSFFSSESLKAAPDMDAVKALAKSCRVSLSFDGDMPQNPENNELLCSAVYESITNCAKHAKGNKVHFRTEKKDGICTVYISNNGEAPEAPVTEGGGLGSLRKKAEKTGARMSYEYEPGFVLKLEMKED